MDFLSRIKLCLFSITVEGLIFTCHIKKLTMLLLQFKCPWKTLDCYAKSLLHYDLTKMLMVLIICKYANTLNIWILYLVNLGLNPSDFKTIFKSYPAWWSFPDNIIGWKTFTEVATLFIGKHIKLALEFCTNSLSFLQELCPWFFRPSIFENAVNLFDHSPKTWPRAF